MSGEQTGGALPTFGADVASTTGSTNYGGGEAATAAAGLWNNFANQLSSWGEQTATDEATRAGKVAGTDPDYRPDDSETTRGIAFRNAATTTYTNQVEATTRQQVSNAYSSYMDLPVDQRQPAKLQASLDGIKQDFTQNHLFPEIQGQWNTAFTGLSTTYLKAAQDDLDKNTTDAARASLIQNTNSASDTAHRVAAIGTPDALAQLPPMVDAHNKLVDDQVNQGVITAVEGQRQKDAFAQSLQQSAVLGRFNALPDAQKPQFLDSFKKSYGAGGTLSNPQAGDENAPRAQRTNNFTNIRDGSFAQSQPGYQSAENGFATFTTPEDGLKAANKNLDSYAAKGLDTISSIVTRWSPPSENDTPALIRNMSQRLGLGPNDKLDMSDPSVRGKLLRGLIQQETGTTPFAAEQIQGALTGTASNTTQGLSPDSYDTLANSMTSSLRSMHSQAAQVEATQIKDIDAAQSVVTAGYSLPQDTATRLSQQYAASPNPNVAAAYDTFSKINGALAGFKGLPPEQIEAHIASAQASLKDGATPQQIAVLKASQNYLSAYRDDLAKDPLGRAAKDGVISGLSALPRDPGQLAAAIPSRVAAADQAAAVYHLPQAKLFTPDEIANFKGVSAAGGQPMIDTAQALATALGPRLDGALKEIGGSAPALSGVAQMAAWNGSPSAIADLAEAQRLRHDPTAKGALDLPAQNKAEPLYRTEVGDALSAIPNLGLDVADNAKSLFGLRAFRDGLDKTLADGTAAKAYGRAIEERLGATYDGDQQYGGVGTYKPAQNWFQSQRILAPLNMKADQVGTAIGKLTDSDVSGAVAGDGKTPVKASTIAGGSLVSVGHGQYQVALGDPKGPDPRYVGTPGGQRFMLDLNALEPQLRQRVPQIYKGGAS